MENDAAPRLRFADLWQWHGTIHRLPYLGLGVLLMIAKYGLDRAVSLLGFDRPWSPVNYLNLPGVDNLLDLAEQDATYAAVLLLLALPFIWMGTALTAKRLRATKLPVWLVMLFFIPLVNLLFFAILCALPSRTDEPVEPAPLTEERAPFFHRLLPRDAFGSALIALLITVPIALIGSVLSVKVFSSYGWSLFVGMPFALGMIAAMLYGYHEERDLGRCIGVANAGLVMLAVGLLIVAAEGAICLIMAAPLGSMLATLGGIVGYWVQKRPNAHADTSRVTVAVWIVLPLVFGLEQIHQPEAPLIAVRTSIVVDAPPETVWPNVVAFSELPPPEDWLFKTGIAYPNRARIDGHGVGAIRYCEFTTGQFVEPITVWDEPNLLAFDVSSQPHPMQEWTFFQDLDPAHLDGYFGSERGQFLLTALPGGKTQLEGTTWYRHRIWPNGYWRLWSDWILHRIHLRVLKHVKRQAEAAV